jgi:uncharacterized RDD family membrane protein YckC
MNYHVAKNGAQLGQMSEEEITGRLATGELSSGDLCWTDGMAEWQPLGSKFRSPVFVPPPSGAASINPYAAPSSNVLRASIAVGDLELAGRWYRWLSAFLENLIFGLCAVPLVLSGIFDESSDASEMNIYLAALSGLLFLALGLFQLVMLATRGQSIGKRLLGMRIVTYPEGQSPGGVKTILLRGVVPAVIGMIPVLGPLFSLVNVCFIFREDRRCIHDLIAGTQVVNGQPPQ